MILQESITFGSLFGYVALIIGFNASFMGLISLLNHHIRGSKTDEGVNWTHWATALIDESQLVRILLYVLCVGGLVSTTTVFFVVSEGIDSQDVMNVVWISLGFDVLHLIYIVASKPFYQFGFGERKNQITLDLGGNDEDNTEYIGLSLHYGITIFLISTMVLLVSTFLRSDDISITLLSIPIILLCVGYSLKYYSTDIDENITRTSIISAQQGVSQQRFGGEPENINEMKETYLKERTVSTWIIGIGWISLFFMLLVPYIVTQAQTSISIIVSVISAGFSIGVVVKKRSNTNKNLTEYCESIDFENDVCIPLKEKYCEQNPEKDFCNV